MTTRVDDDDDDEIWQSVEVACITAMNGDQEKGWEHD